jgi:transposase
MTEAHKAERLAAGRRRPRRLGLPFSWWALQRVGDALAEETGMRVSEDTSRRALKPAGLVRGRPQHQLRRPDPESALNKRRLKRPATI